MYDTTPAAEAIVSRVFHLLTGAEAARMMSSLEIDLDLGETHAIGRALRNLERQRLGYRSGMSNAEVAALAEIATLITTPAPIPAPRDWNDEAKVAVATYASATAPGYALNVEPVDMSGYNPYFRTTTKAVR